jgi:[NiFe] hydrogenase diaphorase moiety large subunit
MDTMSSESLQRLIARYHASPHALVQILREVQTLQGWLPRDMLDEIAGALGLTLAHVQGVSGFYRFLHTQPVGTYRVLFSNNITDRMLGNEALMRDLCERLGVTRGQVRADGRVSVELASCTGLCDQGPALLVNHHQIVTRLNPGRIEHIAALIEAQVPPRSGRPNGRVWTTRSD